MRVTELWRYPVKSLGGESLEHSGVGELGLDGDRRWGLVDLTTGLVLTAKRDGRLLEASSRLDGNGGVVIALPDGRETADDHELSQWLGMDVALRAADDEGGSFEVPLDFENESNWVSWQGPAHAWHDSPSARLSLVSDTGLGTWDARRFRPNVVLAGEGEETLVGRRVQLGSAQLSVEKQLIRCIMVTRAQQELPRDLDVLRAINRDRNGCVAVGAVIDVGGTVAVGDELHEL